MDGFDFFAHGRTAPPVSSRIQAGLACPDDSKDGAPEKSGGGFGGEPAGLIAVGGSMQGGADADLMQSRPLGSPAKPQGRPAVAARAAPRPEASRVSGGAAVRTNQTESRLDAAYRDHHRRACHLADSFDTWQRSRFAKRPVKP